MKENLLSSLLKDIRDRLALSQIEMAKRLEMSEPMYRLYEGGKYDKSKGDARRKKLLKKIEEVKNQGQSSAEQHVPIDEGNIIFVPLYVYGGFLTGYADQIFMSKLQRFFLPGVTGEHYAFEVDGMSMHSMASPGDWVISRREEKLENMVKGKPYVLQTIDGLIIKYFDKSEDGSAVFYSENAKEYPPVKIPLKNIKMVYFVTRIVKKI